MQDLKSVFVEQLSAIADRQQCMEEAGNRIKDAARDGTDVMLSAKAEDMVRAIAMLNGYGEKTLALRLTNQVLNSEVEAGTLRQRIAELEAEIERMKEEHSRGTYQED